MSERFRLHSAVYLLLLLEKEILLSRRFNAGWGDGMYTVPFAAGMNAISVMTTLPEGRLLGASGYIRIFEDIQLV